jgi:hypothetical protein
VIYNNSRRVSLHRKTRITRFVEMTRIISIQHGVSKGVKDRHRPPTLQAGHPEMTVRPFTAVSGVKWVKLYVVHGYPLPYMYEIDT